MTYLTPLLLQIVTMKKIIFSPINSLFTAAALLACSAPVFAELPTFPLNDEFTTSTNETVCIPNSDLTTDKLTNFNSKQTRRIDLNFGVAYTKDYKRAKDIIMQCVRDNGQCLEDPAPAIVLSEQAASSLVFTLKVWTLTESYDDVKADLMERVTDALIANNVEIPYAQLDVHIK